MKPNFFDKVVSWFSPQRACARMAWREEYERMAYDAGLGGRGNRNWHAYNDSAENMDSPERDMIRARARDLERNSDICQSLVRAYRRNVIGKGYTLQARTDSESLNDELEALWKEWTRPHNCDVTGMQSFNQLLRMLVTRKRVDGGILILKRYTDTGVIPLQLQCVEVDELDSTQTTPHEKGNVVVGGIEYNSYRRPVGYYIRQYVMDGWQLKEPVYVPAKDVIFYMSKNRPSQIREMSDLTATMPRIRDANEFITAVSVKERVAACLGVLIKRTVPTGMGRTGGAPQSVNYAEKALAPGMILEMGAGDDAQVINPGSSASDATGFLKTLYSLIGAGQGLSYEVTSRDMSRSNYSSARQGYIEDEVTYAEEIELLKDCVLREIYEAFVISAVLSGKVKIDNFWQNKRVYMQHEFVGTPRRWIDPSKEVNASVTAVKAGQKTFKQAAAENGRDWKEMIDDTIEVLDYAKSKGFDLGGVLFGAQAELPPDSGGEEDEEPATDTDDV